MLDSKFPIMVHKHTKKLRFVKPWMNIQIHTLENLIHWAFREIICNKDLLYQIFVTNRNCLGSKSNDVTVNVVIISVLLITKLIRKNNRNYLLKW